MKKIKLDANHYNAHSNVQQSLAEGLLSHYKFRGDEHILDIGCGSGLVTSKMSLSVPEGCVVGIDPSIEMIDLANKTYSNQHANLKFKIGQAENLPLGDQYDVITAFSCLHWVKNLNDVFANIHQILHHDAIFIGLTYPKEATYWKIITDTLKQPKWKNLAVDIASENWLRSDEFLTMIMQYNFRIKHFEVTEESAVYLNQLDLFNYIKGWLPCMVLFPQEPLLDDFLNDVVAHAWQYYLDEHKTCIIPYTKLEFMITRGNH